MDANDDFFDKELNLNCFYMHTIFRQKYPNPAIVYCSFWSEIWHAFLWFLRFFTQFIFSFFRYSNRRTISSSDRTLINAFRTISGMCDRINLPRTITDRANALFKKVHDGKNLRGRSNDAISSGRKSLKLKNLVKWHH